MRRAAAALFLVVLAPWPVLADETVRVGDLPAISNAGIYVAIGQGFFKEEGVVVERARSAPGAKMIAPLATGQLDVAIGTPSAALYNSIASGMDFRIVADKGQQRLGYSFVPLVVRKDLWESGRVRSVKDLKGLKVASGAMGINLGYFLPRTPQHPQLAFSST